MSKTNEFWKSEGQKAKAASGRGGIVLFAPAELKQNGKVVIGDDNTVKGTVISSAGMDGVEAGKAYTFQLSEAAIKGIDKGVPDTGASTVALLGVKVSGNTLTARHAAVVGDGRMAAMPRKVILGGVETYDKIVESVTIFARNGAKTTAFQAHRASAAQIDALESALKSAERGTLVPKGATNAQRREARMASPISVMAVMYNAAGAKLLDAKPANDTRSDAEVTRDNLEKLRDYTAKHPNVKFAFRTFLLDAEGKPSAAPEHVLFHRPKYDADKGYTVANADFLALVEEADKIGATVKVEAIPYMSLNASSVTDGTYDATAIAIAKRQLALAVGNDDMAEAYRFAMRRAGFTPAMTLSTAVTDKESGEIHPGVLLREPERIDGGFAHLTQMVTANFDGSKVKIVDFAARAAAENQTPPEATEVKPGESAASQSTRTPESGDGSDATTQDEFDIDAEPSM